MHIFRIQDLTFQQTMNVLTFFSTLITTLQDLVVLSSNFLPIFLINIGNKETKHNKKSKVLTSQKKSLFEQKEKPWLLDWKKPSLVVWWCYLQLQYAFGLAAIICRLLYFVLFCLYLIVYTATNKTNNVLLLWTRYILIWRELSLALILKRILER